MPEAYRAKAHISPGHSHRSHRSFYFLHQRVDLSIYKQQHGGAVALKRAIRQQQVMFFSIQFLRQPVPPADTQIHRKLRSKKTLV